MNRTGIFLSAAIGLALLALVVGVPFSKPGSSSGSGSDSPPEPPPHPHAPLETKGAIDLQARLSHPYVRTGQSEVFLSVDLTGADVPGVTRLPVNLALVIDRSGSMSGEKMAQAKLAARQLVSQLGPEDRLAIVHYGSDVGSLASLPATPSNKERMLQFINGIYDDGGTNIEAGLKTARDALRGQLAQFKVNRAILISDGQPTEGLTDSSALSQLARSIRQEGISVSAIGVGIDFNEDLMQAIAELGSGAYGYLNDVSKLATLFEKDLRQATTTVGRDVRLTFELPENIELGEIYGYRVERSGRRVIVPLPDFSAGQLERVVARLVVNAGKPGERVDVAALSLDYRDLLKEKVVRSGSVVAANITDREEEVLARRDKDATVNAARARSAWNMNQAALFMKMGKRDEALRVLGGNQAIYSEAAQVAGAPALADDLRAQEELIGDFRAVNDGAELESKVKDVKTKAQKMMGRIGSTY